MALNLDVRLISWNTKVCVSGVFLINFHIFRWCLALRAGLFILRGSVFVWLFLGLYSWTDQIPSAILHDVYRAHLIETRSCLKMLEIIRP